jgi:hypothetical protein
MSTSILTRWRKAFTTDEDGNDALRTVISGDQNLGGGYITNEQTTTNMMSKGTVYRFDGVDDVITVADNANLDFGTGDLFIRAKVKFLESGASSPIVTKEASLSPSNAGYSLYKGSSDQVVLYVADGSIRSFQTTSATVLADTEYDITAVYDRDVGISLYINGTLAPSVNTGDDPTTIGSLSNAEGLEFGNLSTTFGNIVLSEVMLGNFIPTASEIKDLISGNLPYKWQYGSQTSLVTGDDSTFASDTGTWTKNGETTIDDGGSGVARIYSSAGVYSGIIASLTEIGKEYLVTYDVTDNSGGAIALDNGLSTAMDATVGTGKTITFTAVQANFGVKRATGITDISIDNLTIVPLGAVAHYTQDSISETYWYDKANGNDGAVTGAEVLNRPKNQEFEGLIVNGGFLNIGIETELTIAGGAITATQSSHTVDTEADAASDDLDTINGGKDGDLLFIRPNNTARTIVAKDATGNMNLAGDFTMDADSDRLTLVNKGGTVWHELSRSNNGA